MAFHVPRALGYAQNNWLFYATAGAALAGVDTSNAGPVGQLSERHWHWGWTVGGGVEMRLTPDWSAKVEYLYVGLQDKSYFNPAPSPLFPSNQRVSLDDHIVRVGVNYKLPWSILDSFFKRYDHSRRTDRTEDRRYFVCLVLRRQARPPSRRDMVGRLFPAAHMLVDAARNKPVGGLGREQQMIDANPVVLLPSARLVIPKCIRPGPSVPARMASVNPRLHKARNFSRVRGRNKASVIQWVG